MSTAPLRVVLIKPSKYGLDGAVERFRRGFMPNSTLPHLVSMTPRALAGREVHTVGIDEYVETDLGYLRWLQRDLDVTTLVALVGVQSHQWHRALDLAAYARTHGIEQVVIGGPHAMTCDTSMFHDRGVSFALAEAELIWNRILHDARAGELQPLYGDGEPLQEILDPPALIPPPESNMRRYAVQMLGVYPARGCPYRCNFCSVIKIAGRRIRSQPVSTTMTTLRAAKAAGISLVMFTTDNFNKYPEADELLQTMIDERLDMPFFVQCDVQVVRQPAFIELLARAGCYQMFVGIESINRQTLLDAKKNQNHPEQYCDLVRLCHAHGIGVHFSIIIGFPSDTEQSICEQLRALRALRPDLASFYILTPIPGTEQYEEFRAGGLIGEPNLDRFDGTCLTWRHPRLNPMQMRELLFRCYREFYAAPDAVAKSVWWYWRKRRSANMLLKIATAAYSVLSRCAVIQGMHPMAGGVYRVTVDGAADYAALRQHTYGFELAPLPAALDRGAQAARWSATPALATGTGT